MGVQERDGRAGEKTAAKEFGVCHRFHLFAVSTAITRNWRFVFTVRPKKKILEILCEESVDVYIFGLTMSRYHRSWTAATDVGFRTRRVVHRRYFQHAHFIPIVGVGKRGEY